MEMSRDAGSIPAASTRQSRRKAASFLDLRQSGLATTSRSASGCTRANRWRGANLPGVTTTGNGLVDALAGEW